MSIQQGDQRARDVFRVTLTRGRTRYDALRWWVYFAWGVMSVSPSEYQPACDLVVTELRTGAEVLRREWGTSFSAASAERDQIEAALEATTVDAFKAFLMRLQQSDTDYQAARLDLWRTSKEIAKNFAQLHFTGVSDRVRRFFTRP